MGSPRSVLLRQPCPLSHTPGMNLRDGHLESPLFAVTTLELVFPKLLAAGLKSPCTLPGGGGFRSYTVLCPMCLGPIETSLYHVTPHLSMACRAQLTCWS